ncbi:N-terminal Xaa-Pro-Lys N-methyltransferase 1 [Cladochytrium tenue]|nr:N-terminal Xaa-Pro-Lys N-methyltransferase 1 [Cladochytrium tenue]
MASLTQTPNDGAADAIADAASTGADAASAADFQPPPSWYSDAAAYWAAIPSTVDGMLGGFGRLSAIDAAASLDFLRAFRADDDARARAAAATSLPHANCGAGIGRVSATFLLKAFDRVDLVEQDAKFLERARAALAKDAARVDNFHHVGLQSFVPEEGRYDLIWSQWVVGHLTDDDLVAFLQRCRRGLKPGGAIGIKDNVSSGGLEVDETDSSITRSEAHFAALFARAGLKVVKQDAQRGFPPGMFKVNMYLLK